MAPRIMRCQERVVPDEGGHSRQVTLLVRGTNIVSGCRVSQPGLCFLPVNHRSTWVAGRPEAGREGCPNSIIS